MVFGASGMIGSTVLRVLSERREWRVFGTIRDESARRFFSDSTNKLLLSGIDVERQEALVSVLDRIRPNVVVNCAGLTKHKPDADNPLIAIPINTLMPHRLARLCSLIDARFIHISTDCVFSGDKGGYVESDFADARDLYGKSKYLGEVGYPHSVTLRTSTIGHELHSKYGLLDWFLSQETKCRGYCRAIFSGLPTVVFAEIVRDVVIPSRDISGLYHVAAKPIDKFALLKLISEVYGKTIIISRDEELVIDRSLNSTRFQMATGYVAPEWPALVRRMYEFGRIHRY